VTQAIINVPVVEVPGSSLPQGGQARWLTAPDGTRLRALVWSPESIGREKVRGTILLFSGRTEYAEKYFEVIGELISRGFAVATVDWRGQGMSDRALDDPRKGYVRDFAEFDMDLSTFMKDVAADLPKPWIGLAHSMGGNVMMRALHDHPDWFEAMVLTAPMLGLNVGGRFASMLVGLIAKVGNRVGLAQKYLPGSDAKANDEVPFAQNLLTHDRMRYALCQAQIRAMPRVGLGGGTYSWLAAGIRSIKQIMRPDYLAAIKTPLCIFIAETDALITRLSLEEAVQGVAHGEAVFMPGSHHEIMIETDDIRARFWENFDAFVGRYAPL